MRVGIGYDAHRLTIGRRLILGGVEIPFDKGLEGWSDADVLSHAIMDALLRCCSLKRYRIATFPPNDPAYKGISSITLLNRVSDLLKVTGLAHR